ncbi:MAG: hypothetical protein HY922_13290 [Elusimicrobia bacterium]|nr:hypothetical protein [Elusimicrobiota bacterium]
MKVARKLLAVAVALSLLLTTPGTLAIYASAQDMAQAAKAGQSAGLPATVVPVSIQPQSLQFQPSALKTGAALPTVSMPGVRRSVSAPSVSADIHAPVKIQQALPSRILQPVIEKAQDEKKAWGMLKAVSHEVLTENAEQKPAPAAENPQAENLKPSAETLQGDGSSREWAEKSFDELKDGVAAQASRPSAVDLRPDQTTPKGFAQGVRRLSADEAAEQLSKGGPAYVYSYDAASFQPLDGRVVAAAVRAGRYQATTDASGKIYLVSHIEVRPPADAAPAAKAEEKPEPPASSKHIEEDFFGFRRVRGVRHDSSLKALPAGADVPRIIEQISRQFGIAHAKVVDLGERYRIKDRAAWLAVYDRLQRANREEFSHLDSKKYQGGLISDAFGRLMAKLGLRRKAEDAPWRKLANKSYAPGMKGVLQRSFEIQKHVLGFFIRFPYHLFDSFIFGYFRRNIAYEFFHGAEDFFAVRDALERERIAREGGSVEEKAASERWLESAMSRSAFRQPTLLEKAGGTRAGRLVLRYFLTPLIQPLLQFIWRRATMAILSAAAMGLVAGILPLPLLAIHLSALPALGPALAMLQALPAAAAHLPWVGGAASSVLGGALNALVGDLSIGPLLNSLVLSSIMTFPAALKQRFMDGRHGTLSPPRALSALWWHGVFGTLASRTFWSQNLKSLAGLMMVGAEIEGVMGYAGALDRALTPAFKAGTGHEFRLFQTIGAAVERPQGESPIPFGGAITWGNILIYKLQNLLGFNLTDSVYRLTRGLTTGVRGDPIIEAVEAGGAGGAGGAGRSVVAAVVGAAAQQSDSNKGPKPGDLAEAIRQARERIRGLEAQASLQEGRLDSMAGQSRPVDAAERERYRELMQALQEGRDESYIRAKMAEIKDLAAGRPEEEGRLEALKKLEKFYDAALLPRTKNPGHADDQAVQTASLKALQGILENLGGERSEFRPKQGTVARVDAETEKRVGELVGRIEGLREQAKAELANREALSKLLSALNTTRNAALRERRNGKDMLEFHKNMARLATVMDLAFSLNEIAAAQKAITGMQQLLDKKLAKIDGVRQASDAAKAEAERMRRNSDAWRQEVDKSVKSDQVSMKDMLDLQEQTALAAERIAAFRTDVKSLLARIDAEDSGLSLNAAAEYSRRQALLPSIVEWMRAGKPGEPDYLSLKRFEASISEVETYLRKIDDGVRKLDQTPIEFAGIAVIAVPGVPDVGPLVNPTIERTLQILDERETYWRAQKADYDKLLTEVRNRLSPSYAGAETDDFGESHPISLVRWQAQERENLSRGREEARRLLGQVDQLAGEINQAVSGANLPMLSGLELKALQDAIEAYPDKLAAVNFPNSDTQEIFRAKMALLGVGRLLPQAGRAVLRWSKADATSSKLQDVIANTLPRAQGGLEGVVSLMGRILTDAQADRAYIKAGSHSPAQNQALLDRKRAMLAQEMRPKIEAARAMVREALIPFMNDQIRAMDPKGDMWARLFSAQRKLYDASQKAVERTLPWALASSGAPDGDKATGLSNIEGTRRKYQRYLSGYDDAQGRHSGVEELLNEMSRRKDPNFTGAEDIYGEAQPFSLPRKISRYSSEKSRRAAQYNAQAADINSILERLDRMTAGRYGLASLRLPTGMDPEGQGSVDILQSLIDNKTLCALGDRLSEIGEIYKAKGAAVSMGGGSSEGVPTGTQPSPTVDDNTQVALLAMETAKRLAPSTNQGGPNAPESSASYAVARFLYSNAVISASRKNLEERIPAAEQILGQAKIGLQHAIADLESDKAYVDSNGSGESAQSVTDRKLAVYRELNGLTGSVAAFFGQKAAWDREGSGTVDLVDTYYDSTGRIYGSSAQVSDAEREAVLKMKEALAKTYRDLETNRVKLAGWLAQLNDPHESALRRTAENIRDLQDKTRAVLEQNIQYREVEERAAREHEIVRWLIKGMDEAQASLEKELRDLNDPGGLSPALLSRINALRGARGAWYLPAEAEGDAAALVVPKRDFTRFIDQIFAGILKNEPSTRNLAGLRQDLLANPAGLSGLIPDAQVLSFGDADGFYIVYQTQFSVPHGLESSNAVTFGNVARLWGNNVSVSGYQFVSPPNEENAPWGDKGVEAQIESLQGSNWVNYLNVDLHRFIQDIPQNVTMASSARQSRLLVFDDFAMMLFGDRLYVGAAGFADIALGNAQEKPAFYGGSVKTSLKLSEVMRLNAEQQRIFANDPRSFLQTVNLDFTGLDPDLNQDFVIDAKGDRKTYTRTQLGPSFDIARLIGSPDAFTVDFYVARQEGADDFTQNSAGVSVIKGFTIKDDSGKPWMVISNRAGAERGEQYNTYTDRVSVTLPRQGIALSAEGRLLGDAKTYFLEASKAMGTHTNLSASYGSRYAGIPDRLTLSLNSAFTLGELWAAVAEGASDGLQGSGALKPFNEDMEGLFSSKGNDPAAAEEIKRVFMNDVGRRLITQDIGSLSREIAQLRRAGAVLDNTRIRGMAGFVSNPVGYDLSDRAAGGGFVAGTQTELTLTKTQKALIEARSESLYREGLRLQERLIGLSKQWQQAVLDVAQAQWELKMARYMVERAPTDAMRAEGRVWEAQAQAGLNAATVRYNLLAGRAEGDALPFKDLDASQLGEVLAEIRRTLSSEDRLAEVLSGLDREALKSELGEDRFNLIDWLPWVDRLTLSFGVQLQDLMAGQVLGFGGSVRLPIYDPSSKEKDGAYRLEAQASLAQIKTVYGEIRLRAQKEALQAKAAGRESDILAPQALPAGRELLDALAGHRNGLVGDSRLREAFSRWRDVTAGLLAAEGKRTVAAAWAELDGTLAERPSSASGGTVRLSSFQEAFDLAARNSSSLEEIGARQASAAAMARANSHRIEKFWLDVYVGWNLTSSGVGWIPAIGATGFGVMPAPTFELKPEELKELQVRRGEGQSRYFEAFKMKLEADLSVEIFRSAVMLQNSQRAVDILESEVVPQAKTQAQLDSAQRRLVSARLAAEEARATLNYLLGYEKGGADWRMSPEKALADLKIILADKNALAADKAVLSARVEVARAVETMADKNLKAEELRVEPVSLVVRSLGRLIHALSDEGIGNPDLAAAARIQTLEAERAEESFEADAAARKARAAAELSQARRRLAKLENRGDAESRLAALGLRTQSAVLEAALARMGVSEGASIQNAEAPLSYVELGERLAEGKQAAFAAAREPQVSLLDPQTVRYQSLAAARYYDVKTSLGGDPVGKSFLEGWVEVRLRSQDTPAEVLLALAKLRTDKADRAFRNDVSAARAQARILLAQFETDVRLLRWAKDERRAQEGRGKDFYRFVRQLEDRVEARAAEIEALIGMPQGTPTEALTRLVPSDPSGSESPERIAARLIAQSQDEALGQFARTIFENGLPRTASGGDTSSGYPSVGLPKLGAEDDISPQIKADVIAERMSFKGFTPVGAFGVFRGRGVGAAFLEAPDPRSIERSLESVLSDSLRRELLAQGRMQELTLKLHLLMKGVSDKALLLERQHELALAAQDELRAAALRQTRGLAGPDDVLAAEQRLVSAWTAFTQTASEAKNDFAALVAELEALGFDSRSVLQPTARPLDPAPEARKSPQARVFEHLSRRMLDADFAGRLGSFLRAQGLPADQANGIEELGRVYRRMSQDADIVRHGDVAPALKLDALVKADVEGRRARLQGALSDAWAAMGLEARKGFIDFLKGENRRDIAGSESARAHTEAVIEAMREAFAAGFEKPFAVQGAADKLDALRRERDAARQALLEDYLTDLRGPAEFVLRDLALDAYLKAVTAYDEAVVRLFDSKELRSDPVLARRLDAVYGLKDALARQKALAQRGRGLLAIDALLMLEDARLAALQWRRASHAEFDEVLASADRLSRLRESWLSGDLKGLSPLYAATKTDGGRRLWTIEGWHTQEDVDKLLAAGQITKDPEGRLWLKPAGSGDKLEVVSGVDLAESRRSRAQSGAESAGLRAKVYEALEKSDFALVGLDGGAAKGISYEEASALASKDRGVFYFAAEPGPSGLRAAVHPLKALWSDPAGTETIVYLGAQILSRDRFPTLEALKEHLSRLSKSDPAEAAQFFRLEAGPEGVRKMLEAAQEQRLRHVRAGWMGVKLQTYGFAVDKSGKVAALYMTKDDFDEAAKALRGAADLLPKTIRLLEAAREKAAAAADAAQRQRALSDGESLRYQLVQKEVRERISAQAGAGKPKGEIDRLVSADKDFKAAQKRMSESFERTAKLDEARLDALRKADEALRDLKEAGKVAAAAGLWAKLGGFYLAALKEAGASDAELAEQKSFLERCGEFSLYVTRDAALLIDEGHTLIGVSAEPALGARRLDDRFGRAQGALKVVRGEVFAAVLDRDQTLVSLYMDGDSVESAAKAWQLKAVSGRTTGGRLPTANGGGTSSGYPSVGSRLDPNLRLLHYVEPASGLPVMLNRRYLISRLEGAGRKLTEAENWGLMPWNWGNLLLEAPKGVLRTPIELLTGEDPRQQGYLGRVYLRKIEGGATEHHGFFRRIAGKLDVLDILPDPVQWYFDPSQFPKEADLDSPLLPGQNLYDKDLAAGEHDLHYGKQAISRGVSGSVEDLLNARKRVLSFFEGGVEETWLATRRGRAGLYLSSSVEEKPGLEQLEKALDDPDVAFSPGSEGRGEVRLSGEPGHIEVDKVERRLRIRPGARQYGSIEEGLAKLPALIERNRQASTKDRERFAADLTAAENELRDALSARRAVDARLGALSDEAHARAWRIGAQEALEARMRALAQDLARLREELAREQRHLRELEAEPARPPKPAAPQSPQGPQSPGDPLHPQNPVSPAQAHLPWAWIGWAATAMAAALAAWWIFRRRHQIPIPRNLRGRAS